MASIANSAAAVTSNTMRQNVETKDCTSNRDKISNLPDPLLDKILSLLPAKCAVATSILSKRWRYLWTSITSLEFSDHHMQLVNCKTNLKETMERHVNFINGVNRVFLLTQPSIHKFNLDFLEVSDTFHVNKWICAAVERNVKELELNLKVFSNKPIQLPWTLFYCKTLEVLKLTKGIVFNNIHNTAGSVCFPNLKVLYLHSIYCSDIPEEGSIYFPVLKILRLSRVKYMNDAGDYISMLMHSCPVLEELVIRKSLHVNLSNIEMRAPALRRLEISFTRDVYSSLFYCKTLEVLKLTNGNLYGIPKPGDSVVHFPNLKVLNLDSINYSSIPAEGLTCFPVLKILRLIRVKYAKNGDSFSSLMDRCPVLEDLVIRKSFEDNLSNIKVSSPTLISLEIDFSNEFPEGSSRCKVQIDAPALQRLNLKKWDLSHEFVADKPFPLTVSKIDTCLHGNVTLQEDNNVWKLALAVKKVKRLFTLSAGIDRRGTKISSQCIPSLVYTITRLEVVESCRGLRLLILFLEKFDELEHLVFKKKGSPQCHDEETWWSEPKQVPKCMLTYLRTIAIGEVYGCPHEVTLIEYMLKNAIKLETMTIKVSPHIDPWKRLSLNRKLSTLQRGSNKCRVFSSKH